MDMPTRVTYKGEQYDVMDSNEVLQSYKLKDAPAHVPRWVPWTECTPVVAPAPVAPVPEDAQPGPKEFYGADRPSYQRPGSTS